MYIHVPTCIYMYLHVCTCMYMYSPTCTCMSPVNMFKFEVLPAPFTPSSLKHTPFCIMTLI